MSLPGILGSLAGFAKVRLVADKPVTDNAVFRLHYRFTSAFFFGACLLITAFDLIGNPIDCLTDESISRPEVINTYCWIQYTFTMPLYDKGGKMGGMGAYPGVGQDNGGERRVHSYYQWVPFMLFFQGILFYMPHWLWKCWENGKMSNMTEGNRGFVLSCSDDDRRSRSAALAQYLYETMHTNTRFFVSYFSCEVFNFVNAIGNIFLIDRFLNGAFFEFGMRVIEFSNMDQEERSDPMIEVFPRMTKCTFMKYGSSGTIQKHDALCILALNIINEKVYIFLWFWLIILSIISGLALVYRLVEFFSPAMRLRLLRRLSLKSSTSSPSSSSVEIIVKRLDLGDYYFVSMLGKNLDGFLFSTLVDDLALALTEKGQNDCSAEMAPILTNFSNVDR